MIGDMKAMKGEEPIGTDANACAYLMTVSLTQPMGSEWTQIYLYVARPIGVGKRGKCPMIFG